MIHFYDTRKYKTNSYRIICTKEYVAFETDGWGKPVNNGADMPVTVPHNVTCPDCLRLLIPREEAKLNKMKAAYAKAFGGTNESP